MTDFVIVIATAARLAAPLPGSGAEAAPVATDNAPTLGFHTYPSAGACEQAAAQQAAPPGHRLVCVPVETQSGEMFSAH